MDKKNTRMYINIALILLICLLLAVLQNYVNNLFNLLTSIFLPFFISFAFAFICQPLVRLINKKLKVKRLIANSIVAALIAILLALFIFVTLPSLSSQVYNIGNGFLSAIQEFIDEVNNSQFTTLIDKIDYEAIIKSIQSLVITFASSLTSNITSIILVPVLFLYFLFGFEANKKILDKNLEKFHLYKLAHFIKRFEHDMNKYLAGLAVTILFLSSICAISFTIMGIPDGIFLGVLIGVSSVIPIFGAVISGSLAVIIAYGISFQHAVITLIIILVAQAIESNFLTPNVQGKNLKVHPVLILLSLTVFSTLFGFLGMLLTLPLLIMVRIIFNMEFENRIIESRAKSDQVQASKELYNDDLIEE